MKFWAFLLVLVGLVGTLSATDTQYCTRLVPQWGGQCGRSDSLSMDVINQCNTTIYVKMCIEKKDGTWACGSDSGLAPGAKNVGFWTCSSTGRYEWSSCTGGYAECGFKK